MRFSKIEFDALSSLVFRPGYPGYKPNVVEAPNGDGKLDTDKRYSHVAIKYIHTVHRLTSDQRAAARALR